MFVTDVLQILLPEKVVLISFFFNWATHFAFPCRLCWLFCIALMVAFFSLQVYERCVVYRRRETTTSVTTKYKDSVPFPAVTLCNTNTFR